MTFDAHDLSAPTLKAVIFDIGRVIVRLDLKRAFAPLASGNGPRPKPAPEQIWSDIQADPRWCDWQEGRITPQDWHDHITRQLCIAVGFEEFYAAWNRALDPQTILPDDLFAKLSTQCRMGLLSNTDPVHVAHLEEHFSFIRHFPVRIYSNEIGFSKPTPTIYRAALAALGVTPAEALYIDDVAEYAEAARKLGLDAIHFETPEKLISELSRRGLIRN